MFYDPTPVHADKTNLVPIAWNWYLKGVGKNVSYLEQLGEHWDSKRIEVRNVMGIHRLRKKLQLRFDRDTPHHMLLKYRRRLFVGSKVVSESLAKHIFSTYRQL